MQIPIPELKEKILGTLLKSFDRERSLRITEYLLWAEMSGIPTQGIVKLTGTDPLHKTTPTKEITIERETQLSQLIDGGAWPAPLVSQIATDTVVEKAQNRGFAIVGVRNVYSSNGALAFYAERIAKENLIGMVMARSPGATAPFGSRTPLFGTNPIAFSFPTSGAPLVFDMATSAMTWYGLVLAKLRGEKIPPEMAIDSNGDPTLDPDEAMKGALLPFDRSYKGAGLGMVVELFSGPLINSAFCDSETFDKEWGSTFIAIDPGLLVDVENFKRSCSEMITLIKSSKRRKNSEEIRIPGERAQKCYRAAESSGIVDVDDVVLRELGYI